MSDPWRKPPEETLDLYPGLVVCDNRESGSITFGRSRLPVWAVLGELFLGDGWEGVEYGWGHPDTNGVYGWTLDDFVNFIHNLMQMRGEFGRLVAMLANAERVEQERSDEHFATQPGDGLYNMSLEPGDGLTPWPASWWEMPDLVEPLREQLQRCLDALDSP